MTDLAARKQELLEDARAVGLDMRHIRCPWALITLRERRPRLEADGWGRAELVRALREFADELAKDAPGKPLRAPESDETVSSDHRDAG
jgi:hypothetical protein